MTVPRRPHPIPNFHHHHHHHHHHQQQHQHPQPRPLSALSSSSSSASSPSPSPCPSSSSSSSSLASMPQSPTLASPTPLPTHARNAATNHPMRTSTSVPLFPLPLPGCNTIHRGHHPAEEEEGEEQPQPHIAIRDPSQRHHLAHDYLSLSHTHHRRRLAILERLYPILSQDGLRERRRLSLLRSAAKDQSEAMTKLTDAANLLLLVADHVAVLTMCYGNARSLNQLHDNGKKHDISSSSTSTSNVLDKNINAKATQLDIKNTSTTSTIPHASTNVGEIPQISKGSTTLLPATQNFHSSSTAKSEHLHDHNRRHIIDRPCTPPRHTRHPISPLNNPHDPQRPPAHPPRRRKRSHSCCAVSRRRRGAKAERRRQLREIDQLRRWNGSSLDDTNLPPPTTTTSSNPPFNNNNKIIKNNPNNIIPTPSSPHPDSSDDSDDSEYVGCFFSLPPPPTTTTTMSSSSTSSTTPHHHSSPGMFISNIPSAYRLRYLRKCWGYAADAVAAAADASAFLAGQIAKLGQTELVPGLDGQFGRCLWLVELPGGLTVFLKSDFLLKMEHTARSMRVQVMMWRHRVEKFAAKISREMKSTRKRARNIDVRLVRQRQMLFDEEFARVLEERRRRNGRRGGGRGGDESSSSSSSSSCSSSARMRRVGGNGVNLNDGNGYGYGYENAGCKNGNGENVNNNNNNMNNNNNNATNTTTTTTTTAAAAATATATTTRNNVKTLTPNSAPPPSSTDVVVQQHGHPLEDDLLNCIPLGHGQAMAGIPPPLEMQMQMPPFSTSTNMSPSMKMSSPSTIMTTCSPPMMTSSSSPQAPPLPLYCPINNSSSRSSSCASVVHFDQDTSLRRPRTGDVGALGTGTTARSRLSRSTSSSTSSVQRDSNYGGIGAGNGLYASFRSGGRNHIGGTVVGVRVGSSSGGANVVSVGVGVGVDHAHMSSYDEEY